jgi:hypothetical protein
VSAEKPGKPRRPRRPRHSVLHVDTRGRARMVDVGAKRPTRRVAVARGAVSLSRAAFDAWREGGSPRATRSPSRASPGSRRPSARPSSSRSAIRSPSSPSRSTSRSTRSGARRSSPRRHASRARPASRWRH